MATFTIKSVTTADELSNVISSNIDSTTHVILGVGKQLKSTKYEYLSSKISYDIINTQNLIGHDDVQTSVDNILRNVYQKTETSSSTEISTALNSIISSVQNIPVATTSDVGGFKLETVTGSGSYFENRPETNNYPIKIFSENLIIDDIPYNVKNVAYTEILPYRLNSKLLELENFTRVSSNITQVSTIANKAEESVSYLEQVVTVLSSQGQTQKVSELIVRNIDLFGTYFRSVYLGLNVDGDILTSNSQLHDALSILSSNKPEDNYMLLTISNDNKVEFSINNPESTPEDPKPPTIIIDDISNLTAYGISAINTIDSDNEAEANLTFQPQDQWKLIFLYNEDLQRPIYNLYIQMNIWQPENLTDGLIYEYLSSLSINLNNKINAANTNINSISSTISDDISGYIDTINTNINSISSTISDDISGYIDTINTNINSISSTISDDISVAINNINTRIDNLNIDTKLSALSSALTAWIDARYERKSTP